MSTSKVTLMRDARIAIKSGQLAQARTLLKQAIRLNPDDHVPWIWLAGVTADPEASLECVRKAESLKPDDPLVMRARKWADSRLPLVTPTPPQESPIEDPVSEESSWNWRRTAIWAGVGMALVLVAAGIVAGISRLSNSTEPVALRVVSTTGPVGTEQDTIPTDEASVAPTKSGATPRPTATPTVPRLLAKSIASSEQGQAAGPRATWTMTPVPTNTPTPTPTLAPTFVSPQVGSPALRPLGVGLSERWIDVNLSTQTLAAYVGNTLAFSSLISSGTWDHPTVTGQFRVWTRFRSQTMDGRRLGYDYYLENVPYVMYFYEDYALHGTFWHNNFGTPMSHGCVNMKTSDAQWLFDWSRVGTVVNVHH